MNKKLINELLIFQFQRGHCNWKIANAIKLNLGNAVKKICSAQGVLSLGAKYDGATRQMHSHPSATT